MAKFTAENAAEMARRSHSPSSARNKPQPEPQQPQPVPLPAIPSDEFLSKRLARVRAQLDRIDDLLADEDDPKRLKELAEALSRLTDQEQKLACRPNAGTLKPTQPSSKAPAIMQDATPTPVPQSQDPPLPRKLSDPPDF